MQGGVVVLFFSRAFKSGAFGGLWVWGVPLGGEEAVPLEDPFRWPMHLQSRATEGSIFVIHDLSGLLFVEPLCWLLPCVS